MSLEFDWTELEALSALIAGLNKHGVPYTLRKDKHAIEITISKGF